ncbi:MAG: DUF3290 family protein [Gemella morbillorum]|jgi:hypothetical protein|uniref:DUF3290 family protein n=1 Tax=Gemella morbillorum TaxID=29391 RepID=A0AAP9HDE5_9BACL|nr:DUF3290 family protein [Gemella morbillorum]EFV34772.1 hypothetical protein HMPREF0432_01559 [Gemella morbillorum M424]MBF1209597.1 DUF3290 family protein [Gemella morbillorum]QGS09111.1 DUF3290 family protein [Gemella morbillorum]
MKFYSYDYLQSKLQQNNLLSYIIIAVLIVILCITLIKYYKNRQDTKYRELSIILVLSTLLAVGVSINEYKSNAVSSNQYKSSIHFIEKISNDLNIDKTHIYINSEASIENSFVKVDNTYYRVISSGKKDEYLLEKIELVDPVIEKVEVNK